MCRLLMVVFNSIISYKWCYAILAFCDIIYNKLQRQFQIEKLLNLNTQSCFYLFFVLIRKIHLYGYHMPTKSYVLSLLNEKL